MKLKPVIRGLSHDHIDGSKVVMFMIENLWEDAGMNFYARFKNMFEWINFLQDSSIPIKYRFSTITNVLQTEEAIKMLTYNYGKYRHEQGYVRCEGTFAPQYHTYRGLTISKATRAFYDGLKHAEKDFGIQLIPKIAIGREANEDVGVEVVRAANEYDGEMILDLVGDEVGNPPLKHAKAYRLFNGHKDCHVENVAKHPHSTYWQRLSENLKTAIFELRCDSIGHGTCLGHALREEPNLIKYIVDKQIRITMCPLSNVTLGHIASVRQLHIQELLDAGVWLTLNPDDDLFLPDTKEVINQCNMWSNFNQKQVKQLEENAIRPL